VPEPEVSTEASNTEVKPEVQEAVVAADAEQPPTDDATPSEEDEEEPLVTPGMDWFVLRVASNKEDSVRQTLVRKIKIEGLEELVSRILMPTEKIKTMKGGKQRVTERKLYPGYVFVEMKLEEDGRIPQDVFFLIKETTGVGDFIGTAGRPKAMELFEIEKMIEASRKPDDQPEVRMEFSPGDPVRIKEGPFENMDAVVDALLPEQGKVRVLVTIFGRSAPVEMEYWLIEKAEQ
jgi:transcriptional antiterminator NusG